MTSKQIRKDWEEATDALAHHFAERYFGKDAEVWWVAEEIGGVLHVNDHFFNTKYMVDFLKYKYSRDMMFEYYQYELDYSERGESPINVKNYKKLKALKRI